jgi:DNA-binding CsgD family transcriptional regulator
LLLDELDRAWALIDQLARVSRERESVAASALTASYTAVLRASAGDLTAAEPDLLATIDLARGHGTSVVVPFALCFAADAVLERPELEGAVAETVAAEGDRVDCRTVDEAMLHELRGRLALVDGNPDDARALAAGALDEARTAGGPRALGVALHTLGLLEASAAAISYLEESVGVLESCQARLERARALVDLGAALRRANQRAAARRPLRTGLDLANRCGAQRTHDRALVELHDTGARPRRTMLSGAAALTAAKRRVADLAVQGMSNPEIARTLFVTINTVEGHLRHVYQKLSISSGRELGDALEG